VNLGLVYTDQGRYAEAIDVFQRANPIIKRKYRENDPTYAQFLNNIGYAFLRDGRYTEAKQELERSLSIYNAAGVADTVSVLNGLSMAYRDTGELNEAEKLADRSLRQVESENLGWCPGPANLEASPSQLPCKYGSKLSLDQHTDASSSN
jgi:tetratricopeptide (TPR) repeat protein